MGPRCPAGPGGPGEMVAGSAIRSPTSPHWVSGWRELHKLRQIICIYALYPRKGKWLANSR